MIFSTLTVNSQCKKYMHLNEEYRLPFLGKGLAYEAPNKNTLQSNALNVTLITCFFLSVKWQLGFCVLLSMPNEITF